MLLLRKKRTKTNSFDQDKKSIMIVDFYSSSIATVGGDGHYELVLSTSKIKDKAYLDEYIKESDDSKETKTHYLVPYTAIERCLEFIQQHHFSKWNELENPVCIDGQKVVCKFWDGQKHIRVSNSNMPKNGIETLFGIRNIICEYLKDEYRCSE